METLCDSPQGARPLFKSGRSKPVDAITLDVPPLCYKNPNQARRSRSSTSFPSPSIQSTSGPPNGTPAHLLSHASTNVIDSAASDAEEKTPAFGSKNLRIKLTKTSPRGSLYELSQAALRLDIPGLICWNRIEYVHSEVPERNEKEIPAIHWERTTEMHTRRLASRMETGQRRARPKHRAGGQFALDDGIQISSHKSPSFPTNRRVATLPSLDTVAALRAFTDGTFEWLAEQVLLEGLDIGGTSHHEEPSISSSSVGSSDVRDFSPRTPSNLPLPLFSSPLIVDESDHVQDTLRESGTERETCLRDASGGGLDPELSQGDASDVEAASKAYSYMKNRDFIFEGISFSNIVGDTGPQSDQSSVLVISEQDPRESFAKASNGLHLELPGSIWAGDGLSQHRPFSTESSQTPSRITVSKRRIQSNVTAIPDTKMSSKASTYSPIKRLHSESAVEAQTPPTMMSGRPRANTVDSFTPKGSLIFAMPRKIVSKAMAEAVQIVTPRPSLATLSSLARPRALLIPQPINITSQAPFCTEKTKSPFASVGHSTWESTTACKRVVRVPAKLPPGTSHSDIVVSHSTPRYEGFHPSPSTPVALEALVPDGSQSLRSFTRPRRTFLAQPVSFDPLDLGYSVRSICHVLS